MDIQNNPSRFSQQGQQKNLMKNPRVDLPGDAEKADAAQQTEQTPQVTPKGDTNPKGNTEDITARHYQINENGAEHKNADLDWCYYPVPGLHMGHTRDLLRPNLQHQPHHKNNPFHHNKPALDCGSETPPPAPAPEPSPEPYPSPSPGPTPAPSPAPTPSPSPAPTPAPSPAPTPTPTPYPAPSPSPTPAPSPAPTPTPTPAPYPATPKAQGSLNISGDPVVRVSTPGVTVTPISFHEPIGVPINLLTDPDNGFNANVTLHQVNDSGNVGIQQVTFTVNSQQVQFANNGDLLVNGVVKGNINDTGFITSIDLGAGSSVKTAMADDGEGKQVERFILVSPEYEVTAARRKPDSTQAYFDLNIAERTDNAADNATGGDIAGQGTTGIDDLLRREPG